MQAEKFLAEADAVAAEHTARAAMHLAAPSGCHFVWGFAEAGHLLGQALAQQGQLEEAIARSRRSSLCGCISAICGPRKPSL